MRYRSIDRLVEAVETSDGAGVRIRRSIGRSPGDRLDPFLMLDEFGSDRPGDYIAGFPSHPHRGFETVTYMLEGHMLHEDHLGNRGDLASGDVQWMTAGRGIIHSEMPQQESGLMRGFQLWLNLPAKDKLCDPYYRDIPAAAIPVVETPGATVRVIAGDVSDDAGVVSGPIPMRDTAPLYLDVRLRANGRFDQAIPPGHNAFIYAYEGDVRIEGEDGQSEVLSRTAAAVLGPGDGVALTGDRGPSRCLLIAGKPLNEPIVQYGPFVMNTREEIEQAIDDYQSGALARPARAEGVPA